MANDIRINDTLSIKQLSQKLVYWDLTHFHLMLIRQTKDKQSLGIYNCIHIPLREEKTFVIFLRIINKALLRTYEIMILT